MIYTTGVTQGNLGLPLTPNSPASDHRNKMKSWTNPASLFFYVKPGAKTKNILEQPGGHFTSLKLCQCSQIPQPPSKVTSTCNRTKTITIGLIIYNNSARIKLHHLTTWLRGAPSMDVTQKEILDSPPSLTPLISTRNKKINLRSVLHIPWGCARHVFLKLHNHKYE